MSYRSTDSPNSPGHRQRTSSRDHSGIISAVSQFVGGFSMQTTDPTPRPTRQRARSNSTPGGRLSTSHTVVTNIDHRKHQDRNTWSAGSAPAIVQRAPSTLQRSPSINARNQSQTNLQLYRSPSNSPATPTNIQRIPSNLPTHTTPTTIQRTPSNLSTYTTPTSAKRLSKSSQPIRSRPILFYHKHEPHYGFTNFSNHSVKYESRVYPTSEHLFQSLKVRTTPPADTQPSLSH